ncbi:hypothetical protein DPEC_G00012690 [Dallia pectoralis]|uniref:Uncharacterized protein n=1 Tax=Dallia pectoralis TaxID=75939 RepID=A0ACC2HM26_DALPE|nr:hypothetical protein DPEC_G00012690 [Dallia pectoralis]
MGNENSKTTTDQPHEKSENGGMNGHAVSISSNDLENATVEQKSTPPSLPPSAEPAIVESDSSCAGLEVKKEPVVDTVPEAESETPDVQTQITSEPEPDPQVKEPKKNSKEKGSIFKLLKKKAKAPPTTKPDTEVPIEETPDNQTVSENVTDGIQAETLAEDPPNPTAVVEEVKHTDIDEESIPFLENLEESPESEGEAATASVMNFFKTLVTPTKKTKQDSATPDVTTDQTQKEAHPTATPTVAQVGDVPTAAKGGMSIPPPPPPAPTPPKMEVKAEIATQPVTNTPKEDPKGAAKQPAATKPKASSFGKLFSKKVDASKTATLEASAKPEPSPPASGEDKKATSAKATSNTSASHFNPKELLNRMVSKVQTASTSGVQILKKPFKGAADPKKEAPAPAAEVIAGPSVAKEESKIPEAPAVNNKPVSGPPENVENTPVHSKRLEKRNSINLFFKNLGKRQTDAGAPTEPEKAK